MHILILLNIFFVNIIAFKINYRSLTLDCPQTLNPQNQSAIYAHKTGTGNTRNGRDGKPKYLGLKRFHNSFVYTGNIIVRQRGAHFKPGIGTTMGRDYTISASRCGKLQILRRRISVLDLIAEQDAIEKAKQTDYYRHPTILTLSKLWMQQKS